MSCWSLPVNLKLRVGNVNKFLSYFVYKFGLKLWSLSVLLLSQIPASALRALRDSTWQNTPPNWVGSDPCADRWDGIGCTNSRVTSMWDPLESLLFSFINKLSHWNEWIIQNAIYDGIDGTAIGGPSIIIGITHFVSMRCVVIYETKEKANGEDWDFFKQNSC